MLPQLITAALHPEYLVTPEGDLSHKTPRGPGTPSSAPPQGSWGPLADIHFRTWGPQSHEGSPGVSAVPSGPGAAVGGRGCHNLIFPSDGSHRTRRAALP